MCITVTQALMLNLSKTFALFCIFQTQFWSQQECKKVTAVLPCDVKYLHKMLDEGHDYIIRISNYRLCEYLWCLLNCSIADISFVELSDYSNAIYLLFCPNFVCVNNLLFLRQEIRSQRIKSPGSRDAQIPKHFPCSDYPGILCSIRYLLHYSVRGV